MKCLLTEKETLNKTNNIPLSREGRSLLTKITVSHNDKIFKVYKDKNNEANNGIDLDEKTLRRFTPSINERRVLQLLVDNEKDIIETRNEVLGE